ncbi:MAG: hypothetical protein ACRDMV_24905 [Streptosporangiales bacterium]
MGEAASSSSRVVLRERDPPPAVLIAHSTGTWTGSMLAWIGTAGRWWAVVVWWPGGPADRAVDIVPAPKVRPFTAQLVRVYAHGAWQDGRLLGWRRRPGASWEGEVMTWVDRRGSKPATRQWYPASVIRSAAETHRRPAG